ncbi:hypothetical protein [Bacillus atrophaeus]|nr:hypothetical protein [Bacillus atrophaeus]MEC0767537.1 hypothetical protein [Bacillus atrophaeus]MEC0779401.1 hypothetical protein [Bacillus atrophaeus]MEC0809272.1 hypothetical protein [Bacillus atrophaeus]
MDSISRVIIVYDPFFSRLLSWRRVHLLFVSLKIFFLFDVLKNI